MIYYQKALKNFIDEKLNENTQGILFDVNLYNDIASDDFNVESSIENTYKTEKKRYVPTMITNINGEYIPIPNLNGTSNNVEIIFDLAIDDMTGRDREDEFTTVDYNNTLSAIDEFKNTILANYFPLGNHNLMMGGEDSTFDINQSISINKKVMYFDLTPYNADIEVLFGDTTSVGSLHKTATHIVYEVATGNEIKIPYTANTNIKFVIYQQSNLTWTITDGTNTDTVVNATVSTTGTTLTFGETTGFEGIVKRLAISSSAIPSFDFDNVDTELSVYEIDLHSFDDKDLLTNNGTITLLPSDIDNCVLWGEDGNAVFQVYPLAVVGEYQAENGINYHSFSLQIEAMVGDNFIFGNNFEYYIDDIRVYPVDRNHTFALDTQGRQGINENVMSFIGSESSLDWTQSFFYQPTKQLTSLVKKLTTGDVAQNTVYTIKVQYPFWNKEYNVVVEGGGLNADINSITTFTLQFKKASDILAP
jgi:hypothetical protein